MNNGEKKSRWRSRQVSFTQPGEYFSFWTPDESETCMNPFIRDGRYKWWKKVKFSLEIFFQRRLRWFGLSLVSLKRLWKSKLKTVIEFLKIVIIVKNKNKKQENLPSFTSLVKISSPRYSPNKPATCT